MDIFGSFMKKFLLFSVLVGNPKGVFIIYGEGGRLANGRGGKLSFTPLYRGGQKGFTLGTGEEGGKKSLYPSFFWVLNFCKNCMTFGSANIFTNLMYLQHSKSNHNIQQCYLVYPNFLQF